MLTNEQIKIWNILDEQLRKLTSLEPIEQEKELSKLRVILSENEWLPLNNIYVKTFMELFNLGEVAVKNMASDFKPDSDNFDEIISYITEQKEDFGIADIYKKSCDHKKNKENIHNFIKTHMDKFNLFLARILYVYWYNYFS